jgi:hypothetical protein
MRWLTIVIILLPSLMYSQVTTKTRYLYADTVFVTKRTDSGVAKFDSVWARVYSNFPTGPTTDTTIYAMSSQSGIVDTVNKIGKTVSFIHSFIDTSYVVEMRGYRGLTSISLSFTRWVDSVRFYPAEDSTTVEWSVQAVSPIAGTVTAMKTGTSINFIHSLVVPDYLVSVLGIKNNTEITVGVAKSTYGVTFYPAKDSTQVMWTISSISQGIVIPSGRTSDSSRAASKADSLVNFVRYGRYNADSIAHHPVVGTPLDNYIPKYDLANARWVFRLDSTSTSGAVDSVRASYWSSNVRGNYLKPADSTIERNYSTSLYAPKGLATNSGLTMSTARLLGRTTVLTGVIEEVSAGTNLSFSSGSLSVTNRPIFDSVYARAYGNLPTIGAFDSSRASHKADSLVGFTKTGILRTADSVSERSYSNSLYLKNNDSTSERNYGNIIYLKNADSTKIRNYSNALYLKNADSVSERNYSSLIYLKNADSTKIRNYSTVLYLGLHGTADTAKVAYWATALRGGVGTASVDSIKHLFVDSTNRLQSGKWEAVVANGDSGKYVHKEMLPFDSTGASAKDSVSGKLYLDATKKTIRVSTQRQGVSSFSGSTTRLAVYVAGVMTSNKFSTGPISPADGTLPVLGDLCSGITKTDSLIIQRAAGTTSGLGVWYIQVK